MHIYLIAVKSQLMDVAHIFGKQSYKRGNMHNAEYTEKTKL